MNRMKGSMPYFIHGKKKLYECVFHGVDGESYQYLSQKEIAEEKDTARKHACKFMRDDSFKEYTHFLYCYDERDALDKIRRVHVFLVPQALTDNEYDVIAGKLQRNGMVYAMHSMQ